jgi:hypothetical protein
MLEQTSLSISATLYQDTFNQIFQEGKVAQSFKTGVITPILKKSKDQMLTENYRGKPF